MRRLPLESDLTLIDGIYTGERSENVYERIHRERILSMKKDRENAQDNLSVGDSNLFFNLAEKFGQVAYSLSPNHPTKGLLELERTLIRLAAAATAWIEVLDL